jgi:hypothetical protein
MKWLRLASCNSVARNSLQFVETTPSGTVVEMELTLGMNRNEVLAMAYNEGQAEASPASDKKKHCWQR